MSSEHEIFHGDGSSGKRKRKNSALPDRSDGQRSHDKRTSRTEVQKIPKSHCGFLSDPDDNVSVCTFVC